MAKQPDATSDHLFEIYTLLQDLLKFHVQIDNSLKELAFKDSDSQDFNDIENTSRAIIETCKKIETNFVPKSCGNCCCQT